MSVRSVFPPRAVFQSASPADRTSHRSFVGRPCAGWVRFQATASCACGVLAVQERERGAARGGELQRLARRERDNNSASEKRIYKNHDVVHKFCCRHAVRFCEQFGQRSLTCFFSFSRLSGPVLTRASRPSVLVRGRVALICGYRAHRAAREGERRVAGVGADLIFKTGLTARGARVRGCLLREESRIGTAGGSVAARGQS